MSQREIAQAPNEAAKGPTTGVPVGDRERVEQILQNTSSVDRDPGFSAAVRHVAQCQGELLFDSQGNLTGVDLARGRTMVADPEVLALIPLRGLRVLRLAGGGVTSRSIALLQNLRELEELSLLDVQWTDDDLRELSGLPRLSSLELRRMPRLTDEGISHLSSSQRLARLSLVENAITAAVWPGLAGMSQLELLDLRGCEQLELDGLRHLQPLVRLTTLRIAGSRVTDEAVIAVAELRRLQSLTIEDSPISDGGWDRLSPLALRELSLVRCFSLTEEGLGRWPGWAQLESLSLRDMAMMEFAFLPACSRLHTLRLTEVVLEDAALQRIGELPALRYLACRNAVLPGEALAAFLRAPLLEHLELPGNGLQDTDLAPLAGKSRLRALDLSDNPELTDGSLPLLVRLTGLALLNLAGTSVTAGGIAELTKALPACRLTVSESR